RRQIIIQRQFQGTEGDPRDIKHQRFGHLDLAFMPQLVLDTPQEQRFATPHDPGQGHDPALMDGRFEILEELAMMLGFEEVGVVQALAEAKVLHDVAEHGLILYKRARGAVARAPTPSASPTSSATGCSAPLIARTT